MSFKIPFAYIFIYGSFHIMCETALQHMSVVSLLLLYLQTKTTMLSVQSIFETISIILNTIVIYTMAHYLVLKIKIKK